MKIIIRLPAIVVLFLLLTSVNMAFDGPIEEEGFFPIGWSEKGDVFAYGYYVGSNNNPEFPSDASMVIKIQNMVTDSILFKYVKTWQQTFRGDDLDIHLPQSAIHAWKQIAGVVNKELAFYEITDLKAGNAGLHGFPHGDYFDAELRPFNAEPGYGLYIKRDDGKEKMISSYSEEISGQTDNLIHGFVWDHNKKRIAVIVLIRPKDYSFYTFQAVGCHMKFGFK